MVPARQSSGFGPAVATAHGLATLAAVRALDSGANAVDAAVCANAVLGVVAPETCGIGGDLFALVHESGAHQPAVLNASGRAGAGAEPARLRAAGLTEIPITHPAAITSPGCVDGWVELLDRFGSFDLPRLLGPAIHYAEEGFAASGELSGTLVRRFDELRKQRSAESLLPNGEPARPGQKVRRPDLAHTLRALEDGRDAFYQGRVGSAIAEASDGFLTMEDLARNHANWVEALGIEVLGWTAWTVPPNSQGYLTLAAASILSQLGPHAGFDVDFIHFQIEAYRSVAWERDELVADPDHAPLSPAELLGIDRLSDRAGQIRRSSAASWPAPSPVSGGTTYLCVADGRGLAISLIQSNFTGIGSGIGAGDTGVFLHSRGAGFSLQDGHPNELAPGKRPLHTLSPTLWTDSGDLRLLLGTRGGHMQPQLLLQSIGQLAVLKSGPAAAQAAPRWVMDHFGPDEQSAVQIEGNMPGSIIDALIDRGHVVDTQGSFQPGWGPVSMIVLEETGLRTTAADPRVDTATAVVM